MAFRGANHHGGDGSAEKDQAGEPVATSFNPARDNRQRRIHAQARPSARTIDRLGNIEYDASLQFVDAGQDGEPIRAGTFHQGNTPTMKHGEYKMPGGKLIVADLAVRGGLLEDVQISGDFFLEPDTALGAINAALTGMPATADEAAFGAGVRAALGSDVSMYGISAEAVAVAVRRAIDAGDRT